MAPKIFLTGATGFIGGDVLYSISHAHPDWQWTCLVRDKTKGLKVSAEYPNATLAYGGIDDVQLIEEEASKADIVIHTAASDDHAPSASAIVKGLNRRKSPSPAYYIHTSGAFILVVKTLDTGKHGDRFDKVYDDWDNIHELTSMPDHAPHRNVDKIVLAADHNKIKTAIICPSVVYGTGRGPDKTQSVPFLENFLKQREVFTIGKGDNIWHYIHAQDLSKLYLLLAEAAVDGNDKATWNEEGYYLAENGSYVTREMLGQAAQILHRKGLVQSPDVKLIPFNDSDDVTPWLRTMLGTDSRGRAIRARRLLGWTPQMPRFEEELENTLDVYARVLGLSKD